MKRRSEVSKPSRRRLVFVALAACGSVLTLVGVPASASPESVNGFFKVQATSGPACTSPVGVCLNGNVSGRIKGAFSFQATSVLPTNDTPTTGVIVTTGDAVVVTGEGDISCKLTGTLQLSGDGPFVSLCVITGGTARWAGATGYLRTSGTFTFAEGGHGTYDGKVLTP